ncbi:MAG: hypothetical protein ABSH38_14885, partial [Verrucomicrobiota bacterium]
SFSQVIFAAAAKLFTVGCGAKFAALTLPPMNNFGRPIRARVLPIRSRPFVTRGSGVPFGGRPSGVQWPIFHKISAI